MTKSFNRFLLIIRFFLALITFLSFRVVTLYNVKLSVFIFRLSVFLFITIHYLPNWKKGKQQNIITKKGIFIFQVNLVTFFRDDKQQLRKRGLYNGFVCLFV